MIENAFTIILGFILTAKLDIFSMTLRTVSLKDIGNSHSIKERACQYLHGITSFLLDSHQPQFSMLLTGNFSMPGDSDWYLAIKPLIPYALSPTGSNQTEPVPLFRREHQQLSGYRVRVLLRLKHRLH